jgi:hypothetical protein
MHCILGNFSGWVGFVLASVVCTNCSKYVNRATCNMATLGRHTMYYI